MHSHSNWTTQSGLTNLVKNALLYSFGDTASFHFVAIVLDFDLSLLGSYFGFMLSRYI
jgi:hypothetical protein